MSETVHYRGSLHRIEKLENETTEELAKRIIDKEFDNYYNGWVDMLINEFYEDYIIYADEIYKVIKRNIDVDEDIFEAEATKNGFNFKVKYYNGSCSFNEAIHEALDKL